MGRQSFLPEQAFLQKDFKPSIMLGNFNTLLSRQTNNVSRKYDIQTLLDIGHRQSSGNNSSALAILNKDPEYALITRRRGGVLREKSNSQPNNESQSVPSSEGQHSGTSNLKHPYRQPVHAPEGHIAQYRAGFLKFLKEHASPKHQRVTAGGRVVPMNPIPPPPEFKALQNNPCRSRKPSNETQQPQVDKDDVFHPTQSHHVPQMVSPPGPTQLSETPSTTDPIIFDKDQAVTALPSTTDYYPSTTTTSEDQAHSFLPPMLQYVNPKALLQTEQPNTGDMGEHTTYPILTYSGDQIVPTPQVFPEIKQQALPSMYPSTQFVSGPSVPNMTMPSTSLGQIPGPYSTTNNDVPFNLHDAFASQVPEFPDPKALETATRDFHKISETLRDLDKYMALHTFSIDPKEKKARVEQRKGLVIELDTARTKKEHWESLANESSFSGQNVFAQGLYPFHNFLGSYDTSTSPNVIASDHNTDNSVPTSGALINGLTALHQRNELPSTATSIEYIPEGPSGYLQNIGPWGKTAANAPISMQSFPAQRYNNWESSTDRTPPELMRIYSNIENAAAFGSNLTPHLEELARTVVELQGRSTSVQNTQKFTSNESHTGVISTGYQGPTSLDNYYTQYSYAPTLRGCGVESASSVGEATNSINESCKSAGEKKKKHRRNRHKPKHTKGSTSIPSIGESPDGSDEDKNNMKPGSSKPKDAPKQSSLRYTERVFTPKTKPPAVSHFANMSTSVSLHDGSGDIGNSSTLNVEKKRKGKEKQSGEADTTRTRDHLRKFRETDELKRRNPKLDHKGRYIFI